MSQTNEFLKEIASSWKESDRLDVQLLMAICQLSIETPDKADEGFSPAEIVESVSQIKGRAWSNLNEPRQVSDDVRRNWNKLNKTWNTKQEGIHQHLQDSNLNLYPSLVKHEGGGSGHVSKYLIEWNELDPSLLEKQKFNSKHQTIQKSNSIRYVCEDIQDAGFLARIFKNGYRLIGWRRTLYVTIVALPLLLCLLAVLLYIFETTILSTIDGISKTTTSGFSLLFGVWMVWLTIGAFFSLAEDKIVMSPWWMQSDNNDRLLERRYAPLYPESSINAVRYTSKCPTCDGIVSVKSGGFEFRNRLVGYCEHSPREHVYSFDHITRQGQHLR